MVSFVGLTAEYRLAGLVDGRRKIWMCYTPYDVGHESLKECFIMTFSTRILKPRLESLRDGNGTRSERMSRDNTRPALFLYEEPDIVTHLRHGDDVDNRRDYGVKF